jgi:HK97 family phage portal protein
VFDKLRKRIATSLLKGFTINWSGSGSNMGASVLPTYNLKIGDGLTCDIVMIPVLWAARRMAESPVGVYNNEDDEIDLQHPLARLLKRPTPWFSGSAFRMAQTIEWMLNGNAYAYKIRGTHKEVVALQFVPHWAINPHVPDIGFIDYYEYWPNGLTSKTSDLIKVPVEDIVHLRNGVDPNNIRLGLSPLNILLREIYTDVEASEFTAMLLKNAGVMGVVISPKEGSILTGGDSAEATKQKIMQSWKGTQRGEPMVMLAPTQVDYFGVDSGKLDLSRLRDIPEERISGLLGIPAAVAGFGTGIQQTKVGATMVELRAMAYEDCIIPMQNAWADDWDSQLLPEFETNVELFCVGWDLSEVRVLQDDENAKSVRLTQQFSAGAITRAEYKGQLGYEVTPADEVYYISGAVQLVPADMADGSDYGIEPTPPVTPPAPTDQPVDDGVKMISRPDNKAAKLSRDALKLHRRLERQIDQLAKPWASEMNKKFEAHGERIAAIFLSLANKLSMKAEQDFQWNALEEVIQTNLGHVDLSYGPHYASVAKATYKTIQLTMGLGVMMDAKEEQKIISLGGKRMGLVDFDKQTKEALFKAIEEGRQAGEGPADIAARIKDAVAGGPWLSSNYRAMLIARTETKYAQNISSIDAYKSSDTVAGLVVFDGQIETSDEECIARNGRVVSFEVGESMSDEEHPNGTLSLAPFMGELPDDADEKSTSPVDDKEVEPEVKPEPVIRKRIVTIRHADGTESTAVIRDEVITKESENGSV